MWGSMNRILDFGFAILDWDCRRRSPLWRRGLVAEDVLHLLGPVAAALQQHPQGLLQLLQARLRVDQRPAPRGAFDPVQVGRQRQAPPAHLQVILLQRLLCVPHSLWLLIGPLSRYYRLYRPFVDGSRDRQRLQQAGPEKWRRLYR